VFTLNSDLSQLLRSLVGGGGRPVGINSTAASKGGGTAEALKLCTEPSPASNVNRSFDPEEGDGDAAETSSSLSDDRAKEEAATEEATRQLGSPNSVQSKTGAPVQRTPPQDTTPTGNNGDRGRVGRFVLPA